MSALSFAEVRAEFERKGIHSSQIRLSISAGCAALNYECPIPFLSRLFALRYPRYRSKNNGFAASRPSNSLSSAEAYTLWLHQCTSNQRPVSAQPTQHFLFTLYVTPAVLQLQGRSRLRAIVVASFSI